MTSHIENIKILPEEPTYTMKIISDCKKRISNFGPVNSMQVNKNTLNALLAIKSFIDFFDNSISGDSVGSFLGVDVQINKNLPDNIVQIACGFTSDLLNSGVY